MDNGNFNRTYVYSEDGRKIGYVVVKPGQTPAWRAYRKFGNAIGTADSKEAAIALLRGNDDGMQGQALRGVHTGYGRD